MSTIRWATAPLSLLCCTLRLVQAAHSIAARTQDEVPQWQMWGPYRPNLYFGVRPQIPETFLMGMMWASGDSRDDMLESTYFYPTPINYPLRLPVQFHLPLVYLTCHADSPP